MTYRSIPAQINFPELEHRIIDFWQQENIFERSIEQRDGAPEWVFYEGPPTANGKPGTHHVEARVFKDVFPRFKTMQGFSVPRKAGWDCHGLPVELAVERELGFTGKQDIEKYGVAEFNARCRESVLRHVDAFAEMTQRMGFWVDFDDAYWTMNPEYVESVWWSLKQIHAKGLLVEDYRVAPYCPRCGTGLSDHELAQGYEDVTDPSITVRFPVTTGPLAELGAQLLVWTTTPWTLVSNTAIAVHPDVTYIAVEHEGEVLVVAEELRAAVLGEEANGVERWRGLGAELVGTHYQRPFELVEFPADASPKTWSILAADYVTVTDGTGLVHQSPAFGADDMIISRAAGLPIVNPIDKQGRFVPETELVGGQFFKDADKPLMADLRERGLLFAAVDYEHSYPHCWRCHTVLIYYAQPSWYIRTTEVKDALLRENAKTNWYPETIKHGRYGDWLKNNIDWALSRDRYWGTPLPIWRCDQGHQTVIESRAELSRLTGTDLSELDPHRPYIDEITFPCPTCEQVATRVPQVIDGWYDSGSMPFAQFGYPHQGQDTFATRYPADFICEAIDQTRGWFYTLMVVGTLVFDESSYKNVLCLGHILDEQGRKMSKHLGNILEPIPLMDDHGADALRWFMLAGGSPWQGRRVGHQTIADVVRKILLTYWNTVSFQALYARHSSWSPTDAQPPAAERPVLDRWILSRTHRLTRQVEQALEQFDTQTAGRLISTHVDDISNWYVRRNRRRFWQADPAALATLHEVLRTVTLLLAPFTPFVTERVWQDMFRAADPREADSVHLASWPTAAEELLDETLEDHVGLIRRLSQLGHAARKESALRVRQPLERALVIAPGFAQVPDDLRQDLLDELNVWALEAGSQQGELLVDVTAKANFRSLGQRFGKQTPKVAGLITNADPTWLQQQLQEHGHADLDLDGELVRVLPEDVFLTEVPRTGWAVSTDAGETLALDLTLTPELVRAGLAREVVRAVQDARKQADFDVSDRIALALHTTNSELAQAIGEHRDLIAGEVLATTLLQDVTADFDEADLPGVGAPVTHPHPELSLTIWLRKNPQR